MPQPLFGVQCVKVRFPELLGEVDRGFIILQILVEFCIVWNFFPCSKQRRLPVPPEVKNKNHVD